VDGDLHCLHYFPHPKCGSEALDAFGLPVHDHWSAYARYQCLHRSVLPRIDLRLNVPSPGFRPGFFGFAFFSPLEKGATGRLEERSFSSESALEHSDFRNHRFQ